MKILYLGCHDVLEYDDIRLFMDIPEVEIFSPGPWTCVSKYQTLMRPPIWGYRPDKELRSLWLNHVRSLPPKTKRLDHMSELPLSFVKKFDVVICINDLDLITKNEKVLREAGVAVILRSIGQWEVGHRIKIKDFQKRFPFTVVNYANTEPDDYPVIRFGKEPSDFYYWGGYRGTYSQKIMTTAQRMKERFSPCNYNLFYRTTAPYDRQVFGPGNDDVDSEIRGGLVSWSEIRFYLSKYRAYYYTGTHPAPYTLGFIEALMAGIPLLVIGKELFNHPQYEVEDLMVSQGLGHYVGHTPDEMTVLCNQALTDPRELLLGRSTKQIEIGERLFSYNTVSPQWETLLKTL